MSRVGRERGQAFKLADITLWRWTIAGLLMLLMLAAIAVLVLDLQRQIQRQAASAADNMQWTLGQTEVELMALEIASLKAADGHETLEEVRLRYDIFYSRVATLTAADRFSSLNAQPEMAGLIAEIRAFRADWLPVIDGPDDTLRAALPALSETAHDLRRVVREATLIGVEHFSQTGDQQRASLGLSLLRIGFLTVALVSMLLILAIALFHLARRSDAEAKENRETRERIETILSTSFDAVVVSDAEGRIIDFNGAAERVFGYARGEAIGRDMADLIIPESFRDAHRAGMRRHLETGSRRFIGKGIIRLEALRRDGSILPVEISLARGQSPEGEIFIAFVRDISARVSNEAALKSARDRAIAGEKQKAELLAVMSHEMRTPLNGMLGTLELVDTEKLDEDHRRYLRIVRESGRVLLGHVNDVLDISRLDAGKMPPRRSQFDLVMLLEGIIDNQAQRASARGNRLILSPPNPALHEVYGDADRLRQILLNLVSNAIKFTWNGRITIEADCSGGLNEVEIRVTDTGIGIPEEDIDRIFGDFVTIDSSYGRNSSGTGLGLGISQRLAAAMNGELGVESEPGDGSVFWLRLPLSPPSALPRPGPEPERAEPAPRGPAVEILLVEDNEVNRIVAKELLERDGHRVTAAPDGESALDRAGMQVFDLILMDISMPGLDGLEVSRAIRAGRGLNAATPIVATTAHALPDEVEAFKAAGMQTVLIKPLGIETIRRALADALAGAAQPTMPSTGRAPDGGLIDVAHLHEMRRELSDDLFRRTCETFDREMTDFVAGLPALLSGDPPELGAVSAEAHRMAGSAAVMGAVQLNGMLRAIHTGAIAEDMETLPGMLAPLAACWTATRAALEEQSRTAAAVV